MTTEQDRAKFLALIANGEHPHSARMEVGISTALSRKWMQDKDFMEARAEVLETVQELVHGSLAQNMATVCDEALKSVLKGVKEDPKLALSWLKETGALKTVGNMAGLDTANAPTVAGVSITINTAPPGEQGGAVIDAEIINE